MTYNPKIPIEDGDQFERQLPSSGRVGLASELTARGAVRELGKLDQLLGWVFIVAGIVILVSGRDRTGRMLNWFEGFPASAISLWCLLGIFFGGFLIYGVW